MPSPAATEVIIPLKSFARGKHRLAPALDAEARATLARHMAAVVIAAAEPLPVRVVCDDTEVADFARDHGADVCWTPGLGLNGAVGAAVTTLATDGVERAVVAHADLPFARDLPSIAAQVPARGIALVPDRRDDGTNVLVVPTDLDFSFAYGAGSFARHRALAQSSGRPVVILRPPHFGWDVDEPADLAAPTWAEGSVLTAAGLERPAAP